MPSQNKDYYKILGVGETSSIDEIKTAYRKLAKKYHPDMNPNDRKTAEAKFKEVSEAYYVLGDKKRKEEYDLFRKGGFARGARGGQSYTYTQGFDIEDLLSHLGFATGAGRRSSSAGMDYEMFDDIFGDSFSGGERRGFNRVYSTPPRTQKVSTDVNAGISIPQALAVSGGKIELSIPGRKPITVMVPKGITSGTKLRLAGLGESCPCCSKKGDLLVKVTVG
ncbi:MAG: DnaJ domain-containing protein [Candidatus Margulisiibacteriota bacterium]